MRPRHHVVVIARSMLAMALLANLLVGLLHASSLPAAAATHFDIYGPAGSGAFGTAVILLPNGNFLVTDPGYDQGGAPDVGAVYLYDGASGALISALTGSTANDQVGAGGVTLLSNGNYLVGSPTWDNAGAADAGAVTWGSQASGVSGQVSAGNSLVGSTANDTVGSSGTIFKLNSGDYVVINPYWDNGGALDAGAVTWGSAASGVSGAISQTNSLVGSTTGDRVGSGQVTPLADGGYVVLSPDWDNAGVVDAGAATWGSATGGISGVISAANSLVGSTVNDKVGSGGASALSNGNYVVNSFTWNNGAALAAGAVTFGKGTGVTVGAVSVANSLVGSAAGDQVGAGGVTVLINDNYVVNSPWWDNIAMAAIDAGAATWGSGISGVAGPVSALNSLVGTQSSNLIGMNGVLRLSNANYLVVSPLWDSAPLLDIGAVTWGDGTNGTFGAVSAANSLVGGTPGDQVGAQVVIMPGSGNYVVLSAFWDNAGIADAGAATWGNGAGGTLGAVSALNSLVGSQTSDRVGIGGATVLSNDNYVVCSPYWANAGAANAGAATWGSGVGGISGTISTTNSLVGNTAGDNAGGIVTALKNGNYVVRSHFWDNAGIVDAGAVTWGDGTNGTSGAVSAANSLVGTTANDSVGSVIIIVLQNGNYIVSSPYWDNGGAADAGAVTWGDGTSGVTGAVSASNSLVGDKTNDRIGSDGVAVLSNDNYVVGSSHWGNGGAADAGAATWGSGTSGISGPVSASNSLVGSTAGDQVGWNVVILRYGNYVVLSPLWNSAGAAQAGAVTWGDGSVGISGAVSEANSLVGSTANDGIGSGSVVAEGYGHFIVYAPNWDNSGTVDAGAVAWGNGVSGATGPITDANSVRGAAANGGISIVWGYDLVNDQVIVGRPADNIVTLLKLGYEATIDPPSGAMSGAPGYTVTYNLQVTNSGDYSDTFDILVGGSGWPTDAPATIGPLAPGASQTLTVGVQIPGTAAGGSSDSVTITAASQGDNTKSDSATLTTTADNVYGLTVDPFASSGSGAPGVAVSHIFQVTNNGNTADAFDILASGYSWPTSAPATAGPLAPGASQSVTVSVQIPGTAAGGSSDNATVTITSQNDGAQSSSASLTTTADTVYGVSLDPSTSSGSGKPGTVVDHILQVTNDGNTTDTFDILVEDNTWSVNAPLTVGPLAAGASESITINVIVPGSAAGGSSDGATIIVRSQADPNQQASATLTTTARNVYAAEIAAPVSTMSGSPGAMISYTVQITNTGNIFETFTLDVDDNQWTTTVPATTGALAPGASGSITVNVLIPTSAGDGSTDLVTIIVASQSDPTQVATVALTTTAVHRRIFMPVIMK